MHEMAIAESIVDIALQTLHDNHGTVIHSVQLDLGVMSGVEPDALLFCFDAVTQNTPAQGATLDIQLLPVTAQCIDCDNTFSVENYDFTCPHCGSRLLNTLTGRELQVRSIDID